MSIIEVKKLSKTFKIKVKEKGFKGSIKSIFKPKYKKINAVKNINFEVEKGEILAFIGPNGAGKSTTIKMLTGILYPSGGSISVAGIDPTKDRKKLAYEIGCVFGQKEQLWIHLTPYDNFKFFGAIYDIPEAVVEKRIDEYKSIFELDEFINTPVRGLSLGQRMICEIVASLIHEPDILFLDEPTIGLDPVIKEKIRVFIKSLNKDVEDLREILNIMDPEDETEDKLTSQVDRIILTEEEEKTALLIGGHIRFQQKVLEKYPNLRTVTVDIARVNVQLIKNSKLVLLNVKYMSHKLFESVMNVVKKNNIEFRYV